MPRLLHGHRTADDNDRIRFALPIDRETLRWLRAIEDGTELTPVEVLHLAVMKGLPLIASELVAAGLSKEQAELLNGRWGAAEPQKANHAPAQPHTRPFPPTRKATSAKAPEADEFGDSEVDDVG